VITFTSMEFQVVPDRAKIRVSILIYLKLNTSNLTSSCRDWGEPAVPGPGWVVARKVQPAQREEIGHGDVALMLCEAILHVLVERGFLTKNDALEALDNVSDVVAEMRERHLSAAYRGMPAPEAIKAMRESFKVK